MMSKDNSKTKVLLLCGPIGCIFFVILFLIEGATRPGYNPFRYPISSLSIGGLGWMQVTNFIITGILLFACAIGLRGALKNSIGKLMGPLMIGLVAIGLIGAGIFTTDPVFGYPEGQPLKLAQYSIHGRLHDFFSIFVFACLPVACFIFCRRFRSMGKTGWAIYSALTGLAMPVSFVLAGMGFMQNPILVNFAGVFQRLCIIIGWTWITFIAVHLLRTSARE